MIIKNNEIENNEEIEITSAEYEQLIKICIDSYKKPERMTEYEKKLKIEVSRLISEGHKGFLESNNRMGEVIMKESFPINLDDPLRLSLVVCNIDEDERIIKSYQDMDIYFWIADLFSDEIYALKDFPLQDFLNDVHNNISNKEF